MMYKANLVACIKVGHKVLREDGERVYLPFGSEYAIHLQNLDRNKRVLVNITIDGKNITRNGLILGSGESCDLETNVGGTRKFKFIERTADIEAHRGVGTQDGLVVIQYQFETEIPIPQPVRHLETTKGGVRGPCGSKGVSGSFSHSFVSTEDDYFDTSSSLYQASVKGVSNDGFRGILPNTTTRSVNQVGITGEGSVSSQRFETDTIRALDPEKYQIVFQLLGEIIHEQVPVTVAEPITTYVKRVCKLCGRTYPFKDEYCSADGNALSLEEVLIKK